MQAPTRTRIQIAQESARIIAEEGVNDYHSAKQKAADRLHINDLSALPTNDEIDLALTEYHKIYRASDQLEHISYLRSVALQAMRLLEAFSPRLVGGVLDGNAGKFTPITLHLFPEFPEDVMVTLMRSGIPFGETSHEFVDMKGKKEMLPAFSFFYRDTPIELKLFAPRQLRQTPKNLKRASIAGIESLLRGNREPF